MQRQVWAAADAAAAPHANQTFRELGAEAGFSGRQGPCQVSATLHTVAFMRAV